MKKLIVANWKMNPPTFKEMNFLSLSLKKFLRKNSQILKKIDIVVCPPFLYLPYLKTLEKFKVSLGAQNCYCEEKGAFTGEISPRMLKDFGVKYVILGHSERRNLFQEDDRLINKKIKKALEIKEKVIFCLGEKEKERIEGKTFQVVEHQIKEGLKEISSFQLAKVIFAYEPVWAIGTGRACGIKEAKEVLDYLKKQFPKNPVLYGGSVNSKNAKSYVEVGFDGLLIGGASLLMEEFSQILLDLFSLLN